jgi:hypothetical protein
MKFFINDCIETKEQDETVLTHGPTGLAARFKQSCPRKTAIFGLKRMVEREPESQDAS